MDSGISTLLDNTVTKFVAVISGFVTDHLATVISIALVIGVIYMLKRLVGKY